MQAADAKASDMAAPQTHAAEMRYAAEAHSTAATAQVWHAAEAHPTAATSKVHSAAAKVRAAAATADVSTPTAAAAEAGLRGQWRHNGRQRRQQDCANHDSVIFHEYLPAFHRN